MSKRYQKNNSADFLQIIFVGIFRAIWFLISLPFRSVKFGGRKKFGLLVDDRNYIVAKRLEIERSLNSENQLELKNAVLESDKLVDYALKAQGYSGETFADRLRSTQQFLSSDLYNHLWQGHKVRNQIAHEAEHLISNSEYKNAAKKLLEYLRVI